MLFKELAPFKPNSGAIDYKSIDPTYDPKTNKIFSDTHIIREDGNKYLVGTYTGLLSLAVWDGVLDDGVIIRYITVRMFLKRFKKAERIFLRNSNDDDLIDMMDDLNRAAYVDLKDPELIKGVELIVQIPQFSSTSESLLRNGEAHEKYNDVL